jgi:hypothetical protein
MQYKFSQSALGRCELNPLIKEAIFLDFGCSPFTLKKFYLSAFHSKTKDNRQAKGLIWGLGNFCLVRREEWNSCEWELRPQRKWRRSRPSHMRNIHVMEGILKKSYTCVKWKYWCPRKYFLFAPNTAHETCQLFFGVAIQCVFV